MPQRYSSLRDNPYNSPRVLRAVVDEICERIAYEAGEALMMGPYPDVHLQYTADVMCACVQFRGSPLRKLISIDVRMKPDGTREVLFNLRALSEDGAWLLEQMGLVDKPTQKLTNQKTADQPVKVTRIVEI